jgi:flagellar biosynthesis protein FlhA
MADSSNLPAKQSAPPSAPRGGGGNFATTGAAALAPYFRSDVIFALAIIAIILFMLVPIPTILLDVGLALSIMLSVMILMTVLFIQKPLEFSTFPTVLLVATSLRLGLNVASTRLILSEGHTGNDAAGAVIGAFGSFIIHGNYMVGVIVFAILVIVNFVVITKGSGRIAEVAARFTLDAMPGKQMAIDADLSAGLIGEEEAKTRRSELEQESTFFGAMDGAAKFVRGDAIAGLLITFINVIGGIIIGTVSQGLTLADAAATYTLLTIGDGLVSQIPALIVSVGAGLLVSNVDASIWRLSSCFGDERGSYACYGAYAGHSTISVFYLGGDCGHNVLFLLPTRCGAGGRASRDGAYGWRGRGRHVRTARCARGGGADFQGAGYGHDPFGAGLWPASPCAG